MYVVFGINPVSTKFTKLAPVFAISTKTKGEISEARSILKPVSLSDLSCQVRLICELLTAEAVNWVGASGGVGSVVTLTAAAYSDSPLALKVRTR